MREIKVRAWDSEYGEYTKPFTLEQIHQQGPVIISGLVYEQFIGILDKNGVEIYVGDKLVFESGKSKYHIEIKYGDYEYYPEECECDGEMEDGYGIYCELGDRQFPPGKWLNIYTVIGNIHEE